MFPRTTLTFILLLGLVSCQALSTPRRGGTSTTGIHDPTVSDGTPRSGSSASVEVLVPKFRQTLYSDLRQETRGSEGGDFDVDVSPDGRSQVFSSTRYAPTPKIFMKDPLGGIIQKTSGPQHDIQPKFSPDGEWIAYASNRDGNFDILIIPAHRNEAYWQVTRSPVDEIHPTWSPDGKRIAYSARDESGDWNLMIFELDSRQVVQLGVGLNPEWSPDGTSLAFQRPSQRGAGWYGIWIVAVSGGAPREVFTDPKRGAIQPAWSPDSRSLVFATASAPVGRPWDTASARADDLWVVDLDGMHLYRLTQHDAADLGPAWGLDDRIYFTSLRGKSPRLWSLVRLSPPRDLGRERRP